MRISWKGWHAVHALLCVCVGSTFARADSLVRDMGTLQTRRSFREIVDDEPSHGMSFPKKLIPIQEARIDRNFVMRSRSLEPEAEMLPAHYTRVKPPGVDHMELRYAESQMVKAVSKVDPLRKNYQDGSNREVSKTLDSQNGFDGMEAEKVASFVKGRKGDYLKKEEKSEDEEAGGRKKVHETREKSSGYKMEQAKGHNGAEHQRKGNDHVDHKAAGYHNVYHKDEYKKDHDFYDNDDHGGHLKKHGRYKEKHVATEGKFKKGGTRDSGFEEEELRKKGIAGKSQVDGESKGHEARHGYDRFFKNIQGFVKQADRNKGERSGFGQTKAR